MIFLSFNQILEDTHTRTHTLTRKITKYQEAKHLTDPDLDMAQWLELPELPGT